MNLQSIFRMIREKDWDWVIVLDGGERTGKTLLATQILLESEDFSNEPMRALKHIVWDFQTYEQRMRELPQGSCIIFNEASLLGRRSNTALADRMVKILTTSGARNMLTVLTFPTFRMLDPYLRNHRVRTRGYVHTVCGERGYVDWSVRIQRPWEGVTDT